MNYHHHICICCWYFIYIIDLHLTVPTTCFGIVGFFASTIMALIIDGSILPKTWMDTGILLVGGMLSLLGQFLTTIALKLESAGKVALSIKASQILFSFIFQILLFDVSNYVILWLIKTTVMPVGIFSDITNGKIFIF